MNDPRSNAGDDRLRLDVSPARVALEVGEVAEITVEVTNTSETIRMFQVDVLGLDPDHFSIVGEVLQLFPDERGSATIIVSLPAGYPSGEHRASVRISEPGASSVADVVAEFDVVAPSSAALEVRVDPSTSTSGGSTTFIATVVNTGNISVEAGVSVSDPERLVTARYSPSSVTLPPGGRGTIQIDASGPRPWFGMPLVRTVEVAAHVPPKRPRPPAEPDALALASVAFIQRPRFSRRAVSIAGLLLAVTMFALVINASFASVAELSEANAALLKQSLGADGPIGARPEPASISGRVTSTTGGGIDGATVEIYEDSTSALVPVASTVTTPDGAYGFGSLASGVYRLRFTAAGFGDLWYPDGATIADAFPIELGEGSSSDAVDMALAGQPGLVSGRVFGDNVEGAIVSVQIPAGAFSGTDVADSASIVATTELDATGSFSLGDLPTPSAYQLVVTKSGFATEVLSLDLGPGEATTTIEVLLRRGDGRISGTVVDAFGEPIPGVDVIASDGLSIISTRTLSGDAAGSFEIRELTTPATFTVSAEPEGYEPQSVTVELAEAQRIDDLRIVLNSSTGSIAGTVTDTSGDGIGGVTVTAVGSTGSVFTRTLSVGDVGSWYLSGLPVPGVYTVRFVGDGLQTQALSVDLTSGAGADRREVDVTLAAARASVSGTVIETGGDEISGVSVVLSSSAVTKSTLTANTPAGRFQFDALPAGAYTLTFSRVGSTPQTILIDLAAGQALTVATVALEPQARITGTVTRFGVATADVGVLVSRLEDYPETVAVVVTGADGTFEVVGISAPETYIVSYFLPIGAAAPIDSETVFLEAGETLSVGTVSLTPATTTTTTTTTTVAPAASTTTTTTTTTTTSTTTTTAVTVPPA